MGNLKPVCRSIERYYMESRGKRVAAGRRKACIKEMKEVIEPLSFGEIREPPKSGFFAGLESIWKKFVEWLKRSWKKITSW